MNFINGIREKLRSIDEVVPILVFFELVYLGVGQLIIWLFLPVDKPTVALGFAIGVGFAVLSSIQNAMILGKALTVNTTKRKASGKMILFMLIRIACISGVVVLAVITDFCNPVAVLIGVLAIQLGVYFEPYARKRRQKKERERLESDERRSEQLRSDGIREEEIKGDMSYYDRTEPDNGQERDMPDEHFEFYEDKKDEE